MLRILTHALLVLMLMAACKHKAPLPVPAANIIDNGGVDIDTGICFTRDILPIFISNCAKAGCHDAMTARDGYRFTDYNSIVAKEFVAGNADETELYEKITEDRNDKRMPPMPNSPLTAAQISLIRRWINEGAKNTTGCSTPCDSNNYSYASGIKPVFDKYCKGCHSGANAPKGILLDSYLNTKSALNSGRLLGAMKHEAGFTPMPFGGSKLSDCEIRQVEKWIEAGAQDN